MNASKLVIGMLIVIVAAALWTSFKPVGGASQPLAKAGEGSSHVGFVSISMPDGVSSSGIVIFAPKNCPSDAAQRAERLADFLEEKGIGFTRSQSASYNSLTSKEEAERVMAVMNGDIPIVYVNGRAKANPTPEEVEAEYRRSGS